MTDKEQRSFSLSGTKVYDCRYGENPWQTPCNMFTVGSDDPLALDKFKIVAGKGLGRTNWTDVDRLLQTMTHAAAVFDEPNTARTRLAFGVKHGNCCGGAFSGDNATAIQRMITGNNLSIFGGSIMTNFVLGARDAQDILKYQSETRRMIDVIAVPGLCDSALEMLRRKGGRCQILVNPALHRVDRNSLDQTLQIRQVRGGFIVQPNYTHVLDLHHPDVSRQKPSNYGNIERGLMLAWAIGATSNSNTIVLVKNGQLIGSGVGQMDRVGAAELAIKRARDVGHDIKGAVAYSDSFFPFADGINVLAEAGVIGILTCSGSMRDKEIQQACISHEIDLYMIPVSMGRGFYGH